MTPKNRLPNIILIVMDTVGAKHMSLYGYPRQTTPNLARIAAECTVYTRCFAPACWTIPSHASLFTGLYPSQHGTHEANLFLSENCQHIASVLKMAGYRNFGISSNILVSPESGLCRDFDYLKIFNENSLLRSINSTQNPSNPEVDKMLIPRLFNVLTTKERINVIIRYFIETGNYSIGLKDLTKIAKHQIRKILDPGPFIKSAKYTNNTINLFRSILSKYQSTNNQPFFFFINFLEAHERYRPPLRHRTFSRWHDKQLHRIHSFLGQNSYKAQQYCKTYINLYDDEIVYLDTVLAEIWNALKDSPFFDNTLILITSDHGEHFGEKGMYGHALSLYNELIWIPLMVKYPPGLVSKGFNDRLVSLNDLYATILDLLNIPFPIPETSFSLLRDEPREVAVSQVISPDYWSPHLKAKQEIAAQEGGAFSPPAMAVLTAKGMKLLGTDNGGLQIYDLNQDMEEENNLAPEISQERKGNFENLMEYLKEQTGYLDAVKLASQFKNSA